jgi:hypothetical protein
MTVILEPSCRDRLHAAVDAAVADYHQLKIAISSNPSQLPSWGSSGKPGSKPPWLASAAYLFLELHHDARLEERRLRLHLFLPIRPRGDSDANTLKALSMVTSLAEAAGTEPAASAASWLERWHGRAARVLGEASPVMHLPRQPGEKERPCPFCRCLTLRFWSLEGRVRCINPGCRDDEGRRPAAVIEYSGFTQQLELRWQDQICGLPAPQVAA